MDNSSYLRSKGFNILTGEACGYSMRLLVDVTAEASEILKSFWGVADITLQKPWNPDAIGSVMLTREAIWNDLIPYMMLMDGAYVVYRIMDDGYGHDWYAQTKEFWAERGDKFNSFERVDVHINWAGTDRNRHEWTGRIV